VAPIPGTNYVMSGSADNTILIYNYQTGELFKNLTGHTDWVKGIVAIEGTNFIVSASYDQTLKV